MATRRCGTPSTFLLVTLLAAACNGPEAPLSSQFEITPEKPDGFSLSKNVLLVADNQLNHLFGDPIWLRTALNDHFVPVTIRPIQQDLFGIDLLARVVELYGTRLPMVHLGDGMNMGCGGEFARFQEVMSAAQMPWVMAPGNHDAYLLGNLHEKGDGWDKACRRADGAMTKERFIRSYLDHLLVQHDELRQAFSGDLPATGDWRSSAEPGDADTFLRAVAWTIDAEAPWRSFVVQELDLGLPNSSPPISAIVMDSSQYAQAPILLPTPIIPNAGVNGDFQDDQLAIVERWLAGAPAGTHTFLLSHHPYGDLLRDSRERIDGFRSRFPILLYVSAHTHLGQYFVRGEDDGWLELNVGSVVDWPMEFRTLSVHEDRDRPDRLVLRTPVYRLPDAIDPKCDPSWEALPGSVDRDADPDYFLSYADSSSPDPKATQSLLMDAALWTYRRLFATIASAQDNDVWPDCCDSDEAVLQAVDEAIAGDDVDAKITLLMALDDFDRRRGAEDPALHRDYRICQAVWASKYDKLGRRQPEALDPYIVFPRR